MLSLSRSRSLSPRELWVQILYELYTYEPDLKEIKSTTLYARRFSHVRRHVWQRVISLNSKRVCGISAVNTCVNSILYTHAHHERIIICPRFFEIYTLDSISFLYAHRHRHSVPSSIRHCKSNDYAVWYMRYANKTGKNERKIDDT